MYQYGNPKYYNFEPDYKEYRQYKRIILQINIKTIYSN